MLEWTAKGTLLFTIQKATIHSSIPSLRVLDVGPHVHVGRHLEKRDILTFSCHHVETEKSVSADIILH